MNLPEHLIISSYYVKTGEVWGEWLRQAWCLNVMKHAPNSNSIIISQAGQRPQFRGPNEQWVFLNNNLGHVGQHISGELTFRHTGYTAALFAGLWLAYTNVSDAIFLEQDALAFGPWREKLYEEIGDRGLLFGSCRLMPSAQSLFIVRHWFIPEFIQRYMAHSDIEILGESKFAKMEKETPKLCGRFSFPYDRDRPIDPTLPVFYAQKLTPDEARMLAKYGLMSVMGMPDAEVFSNCK